MIASSRFNAREGDLISFNMGSTMTKQWIVTGHYVHGGINHA